MNKIRFWAILTLVLGLYTVISPLFGETYLAVAAGLLAFGSLIMYVSLAEDSVKVYGYPIFW